MGYPVCILEEPEKLNKGDISISGGFLTYKRTDNVQINTNKTPPKDGILESIFIKFQTKVTPITDYSDDSTWLAFS